MTKWQDALSAQSACREARDFAASFKSFADAWSACERGDWMLWWIGRTIAREQGPERRRLVKVACQCARLVLDKVPAGAMRPLMAIEVAEQWANDDPTVSLDDVRGAADAAAAAAYAAYAAAAYAAYAAAYAADAAAAADAADAARASTLLECAKIVRVEYPEPPM